MRAMWSTAGWVKRGKAGKGQRKRVLFQGPVPTHSSYENGQPLVCRDKVIETASIFTMNIPEKWLDEWKYPQVLESNTQTLKTVFGASESLYACDTYQFTDYSRYDITLFDEAAKRAYRDAQFPIDLANARALGKRLVEKAVK